MNGQTDGPTNGQSLLKRCVDASKKLVLESRSKSLFQNLTPISEQPCSKKFTFIPEEDNEDEVEEEEESPAKKAPAKRAGDKRKKVVKEPLPAKKAKTENAGK